MTTILFIHGTGSRDRQALATFERVRDGIQAHQPKLRVERCYWGALGAPQKEIYDAVHFADGGASGDEEDIALWTRLLSDPLFEIKLRPSAESTAGSLFDAEPPDEDGLLARRIERLRANDDVLAALAGLGLRPGDLADAITDVAGSDEFGRVYGDASTASEDDVRVLSRALVAGCLRAASDREPPVTGRDRDELVTVIGGAAFGTAPDAGLGDPFARLAKNLALPAGARLVPDSWWRKGQLAAIRMAGDILVYQARGEAIRNCVRQAIDRFRDDTVVLLAHSLGGVIAFDLLATDPPENVRMLVTAGSQVPLFYELGALWSELTVGDPLPSGFTVPWVNVYDPRDMLAYAGRAFFGTDQEGKDRCEDKPVDNGMPFPYAHSAYWGDKGLYEWLVRRWEAEKLCH